MAMNRREDTYRQASDELAHRLVILYGVKIFPRQGKVFADMLYQTGIEAGSYVATLGEVDERTSKISLANNALIKLTQTDYLLSVMIEGKYYEPSQTEDLAIFLRELIRAIKDLLNILYGPKANRFYTQMRPVFVPPARLQPQQMAYQQPVAAPAPAKGRMGDPDGFDLPPTNVRGANPTAVPAYPAAPVYPTAAPVNPAYPAAAPVPPVYQAPAPVPPVDGGVVPPVDNGVDPMGNGGFNG